MNLRSQKNPGRERLFLYLSAAVLFLLFYFGVWTPYQRWGRLQEEERILSREVEALKREYEQALQHRENTAREAAEEPPVRHPSRIGTLLDELIRPEQAGFRYELIEFLNESEESPQSPLMYLHVRGRFRHLRDFLNSLETRPTISIETAGMQQKNTMQADARLDLKVMARINIE